MGPMQAPTGYESYQNFTPQQMQLFQGLFSNLGPNSYLGQLAGGSPEAFSQIEAPQMRQFQELLGGLSSKFSGMGGLGARHSSGFQNTATSAASDFAQQLGAKRHDLTSQALRDLMSMSSTLLGQQPYSLYQPPMPFWQQLLLGMAGGAGQAAGSAATAAMMA